MPLTIETLRSYCLQKPGAREDFPFDNRTLVFKVMGKMFVLTNLGNSPLSINLKCDPDLALTLRHQYQAVQPGYHMNKRHWNTVTDDGSIPLAEIYALIDHSYELVVNGLTKADREKLAANQKRD